MNKILERAVAAVASLPEDEQEAIAHLILEEIEAERGWDERFAKSQVKLAELAKRAREHVSQGTSLPYDPSDCPSR